jgi:hypothetical protein
MIIYIDVLMELSKLHPQERTHARFTHDGLCYTKIA